MSSRQDREIAHLEEVNAELKESLRRCRQLLLDCREKLAANANEPSSANDDDQEAREA